MRRSIFFEVIGAIALGVFVGFLINAIAYDPIPFEPFDQQLGVDRRDDLRGAEVLRVGPGAVRLCTQAFSMRSVRINGEP